MCSHASKRLRKHYSAMCINHHLFKPFPVIEEAKSAPSPKLIKQNIHSFPGQGKESVTLVAFASHKNMKPKGWRHPPNTGECSTRSNTIDRLTRKRTKIILQNGEEDIKLEEFIGRRAVMISCRDYHFKE